LWNFRAKRLKYGLKSVRDMRSSSTLEMWEMNKIDMEIKSQILAVLAKEGVPVRKIILFGSRARGESREDSDYDLLVIVAKPLTFREKVEVSEKIRDRLVGLNIASDIVVKSEVDVEYYRNKIGSVVREALKEGVTI